MVREKSGRNDEKQRDGAVYFDGGEGELPDENGELHYREEDPQGLLYFTRFDSVPIMVDALFDSPTSREFTATELASKAGLNPRSVRDRIGVLEELGIVRTVDDTNRYTLDLDHQIPWTLRNLDGQIRLAQSGDPPRREGSHSVGQSETSDRYELMSTVRQQATGQPNHAD